ncbi:MAG: hypothetical protein ACXWFW_07680 [Usitatibacter sp.]
MSQTRLLSMILTVFALAVPCAASAAPDGANVFKETCSDCHNPDRQSLDDKHMSREEWKENVDRMLEVGNVEKKKLPKGEYAALLDYLASTHGPSGTSAGAADKK